MNRRKEQSDNMKDGEIFCRERLEASTGGDIKFAQEVLETFIASFRSELAEMHEAAGAEDLELLRYYARMARSGCQAVGASLVAEMCLRLEKSEPTHNASQTLSELAGEADRFWSSVRAVDAFRSLPAA